MTGSEGALVHLLHRNAKRIGRSCALAAAVFLAACQEENSYVPPPPPEVTVAPVLSQKVTRYVDFTGNTASINAVDLNARVQGFLRKINYTDGQYVKKGTVLFVIEQDNYKADVEQAEANLAARQADQVQAEAEFYRQNQLAARDFSSQSVLDVARAKRASSIANTLNAKAALELARIQLGYTEVTAPFDGIVTAHLQDVGALVGYGGPTKLASIIQVKPIYVWFTLNEQQALRIHDHLELEGTALATLRENPGVVQVQVGLQTEQGYPHTGKLDYIAPQVDPNLGTLSVRALLENADQALLPGLFARVRIPVGAARDTLLVPDAILSNNQMGFYLLTVDEENVVSQTPVTLGQLQSNGLRAIESGLKAGDRVVISGIQRAVPGSKITPKPGEITGTAPIIVPAPGAALPLQINTPAAPAPAGN
ncbi:efflux RND transporter periplasmic adaptor subunit [Xanthobacter sp. TB0136]|uniref:efflux RND transporter periplasmic adaptor subunit n=1 Tax=Xanthobacter sp. TB0136 TaxID=3459177 RepID=UPI004039FECE